MRVPLFDVQPSLCRDFDMFKMALLDNLSRFALRFSSKNSFWGSSDEMQQISSNWSFIHSGLSRMSIDYEQSLFYSQTRREEHKTSKHANVTVSVMCKWQAKSSDATSPK